MACKTPPCSAVAARTGNFKLLLHLWWKTRCCFSSSGSPLLYTIPQLGQGVGPKAFCSHATRKQEDKKGARHGVR
eukprot:357281-Chlamydomonas_euryale.AAC.12